MKLMICGSRAMVPAGLDYTSKCIERVQKLGWEVICGDAPGVDQRVLRECQRLGIKLAVYTPIGYHTRAARYDGVIYKHVGMGYSGRDQEMVKMCDRVLVVWNGESRGSKAVHDFALGIGKQVDMRVFP